MRAARQSGLLWLMLAAMLARGEPLPLVTGELPPYVSRRLSQDGPLAAIVRAACSEAGLDLPLTYYPWLRAEAAVHTGQAFGAFPYRKTPERAAAYDFSDPLMVWTSRFFYLKSHFRRPPQASQLTDLRGLVIGGTLGYWYAPLFGREGLTVDFSASETDAFNKLRLGRTELVPVDENLGWWQLEQLFPGEAEQFATLEPPLSQGPVYLMVKRGYSGGASLLARFNKGLAAVRAKGVYQRILARYRLRDKTGATGLVP